MSCTISKELADFLNLNYSQNGERISRVKITKLIDSYIETNGLRDHRTVKPDEKLKNLLNCGDNEVTFANLQSYIAPHIICMNCINVNVNAVAVVMILSPPPPSAPPLSPECAYAVFPEDELPESPVPPSPSIYAVFPEDEIIPQVELDKAKAEAQMYKAEAEAEAKSKAEAQMYKALAEAKSKAEAQMYKAVAEAKSKAEAQMYKAVAEAKSKAERNCFNCGKPGHSKIDCPYYFST